MFAVAPNLFSTPSTLAQLISHVRRQQKFLKNNLAPVLQPYHSVTDGSLDESDFKKINTYYGLAVPAILGEALCTWRGKEMSERERTALTYQGAMTGLFDDFFDKHNMPEEKLKTLLENPGDLQPADAGEKLFIQLYTTALANTDQPDRVLHYLRRVYDAQVESKKQAVKGSLGTEKIYEVTIEKGGVSVLFYRAAMEHELSSREETALYLMGGLMQLGNDIFDVYKDSLKGIETPMTIAKHVNTVRIFFNDWVEKSFNACLNAGYPEKNTVKFLRLVSMSLCARCWVCLDQLESLEKKTGGHFDPLQCSRQELVCDFEKRKNTWRSIKYHMFHPVSGTRFS